MIQRYPLLVCRSLLFAVPAAVVACGPAAVAQEHPAATKAAMETFKSPATERC